MAGDNTLARRYARALLDVAIEEDAVARIEGELHGVAEAYRSSRELRSYLRSPAFGRQEKRRTLGKLFGDRVHRVTLSFLQLLVRKGRFPLVGAIAKAYDAANDAVRGIQKASVTTFLPLSKPQRKTLIEKLQRLTRRQEIRLEEAVDDALLGGIVVRLGDTVLDGSVRGRLERLRNHLWLPEEKQSAIAASMAMEKVEAAQGLPGGDTNGDRP